MGPQREDDQEGASEEEEEEEERWIWEGRRGKEHRVLVCYVLLHTLHDHSDKLMNTLVGLVESRRAVVVCMVCFLSLPSFSSSSLPTLPPPFPTHAHTHNHSPILIQAREKRDNGVLPLRPCQAGRRGLGPSSGPGSQQELHTLGGGTRWVGREEGGRAWQEGEESHE